jgi:hypothetical protein
MQFSRVYIYNGVEQAAEEGVGYKVMLPNWKARERGFQYEVGKTYCMDEKEISLCKTGFHYCEHAIDCLQYYDFVPRNKFSQVKIHGKVVQNNGYNLRWSKKCATNIIEICNEISFEKWMDLCTVTVIVFRYNNKFTEDTYVKGILETKLKYFDIEDISLKYFNIEDVSEQKEEDVVQYSCTRVPNLVPFRYNVREYRANKTLNRTSTWNEKTLKNVNSYYDLDGVSLIAAGSASEDYTTEFNFNNGIPIF